MVTNAYTHIIGKEFLAILFGERNVVLDFGAMWLFAEMAVANSLQANRIVIYKHMGYWFVQNTLRSGCYLQTLGRKPSNSATRSTVGAFDLGAAHARTVAEAPRSKIVDPLTILMLVRNIE